MTRLTSHLTSNPITSPICISPASLRALVLLRLSNVRLG